MSLESQVLARSWKALCSLMALVSSGGSLSLRVDQKHGMTLLLLSLLFTLIATCQIRRR